MTRKPEIVRLQVEHRARAVDSVTRAFLDDPMWSWVLPDREARSMELRPMWDALIGFSRVYGDVFTTLPQGRNMYGKDVEAVVEILSEAALLDQRG